VLYLQEEKVLVHLGAEEERGTESWILDTGFTNAKLNLRSIGGSRPSGRIGDTRTTSCLLLFVSSPRPPHIIGISSSGRPYPHSGANLAWGLGGSSPPYSLETPLEHEVEEEEKKGRRRGKREI